MRWIESLVRYAIIHGLAMMLVQMSLGAEPAALGEVQRLRVQTEDGAEIVLTRYRGDQGKPVLLCHGISSNHHFWDLAPDRSLARFLARQGYDVWNLDLRGHGDAERDAQGKRQRPDWTMDAYGLYDLPAAIQAIKDQTGKEKVDYVGHSMGGLVLAIYLSQTTEPSIGAAVVVASPLDFQVVDPLTRLLLRARFLVHPFRRLPTPAGARLLSGLQGITHLDDLLYNPANVAPEFRKMALRRIVSPVTRGELRQLTRVSRAGEFESADGAVVYRTMLEQVRLPMLFIAGRLDRIAPPHRVRGYYEAVGSDEKRFIVAGRTRGMGEDYGHLDFGIGDHAEEDIFPVIESWLDPHKRAIEVGEGKAIGQ